MNTTNEAVLARIAGFWIRLLADLLDALILGVVGFLLATLFREPLYSLGQRGVFIGLAISLVYSGVLQSRHGGGRTPAKALLGLRVVRLDGGLLSLERALVRYALVGCMFYGTAVAYALLAVVPSLPATGVLSALMGAQVALFLGCAFMVPFHPLKRGLHDLVAGSIVVKGGMPSAEIIARGDRPRRDRWLLGGAGALVVGATVVGASLGYLSQSFKQMVAVVQTLKKMGIQSPNVTHSFFRGDGGSRHAIFASGFIPPPGDGEPTVSDLQQEILTAIRRDVSLDGVDQIGVTLSWGINLGIYRSSSGVTLVEPVRRE